MKNTSLQSVMIRISALCMMAVVWASIPSSALADPPVTTRLLVEGHASPLALKDRSPRFSWVIEDPVRWDEANPDFDEVQKAYRILVASSRARIDEDKGDLWDSGKVTSPMSTLVPYGGAPLAGKTRYWWKVRTWNRRDEPGPFSRPARFETGLRKEDWRADFIWDGTENANNYCYLRKRFEITGPISYARAYLFAHDDYRLYVNGRFVGRGPAPSDPYEAALYNPYDIAAFLSSGPNVVAVIAHYHGEDTGCSVKGAPAFLFQAEIECGDARRFVVCSDSTWKCLAKTPWNESSPVRGPDYARATSVESIDGRKRVDGWMDADFDDSSWSAPEKVDPGYRLEAQEVPGSVIEGPLPPIRIERPEPGIQLVDFGFNATGWPELKIDNAKPGNPIRIDYAEEKNGDRIVRDGNWIDNYHDEYICRGGREIFAPDTKYNGFRYVEIEGYPGMLTADRIGLMYTHTRLEKEGDFRCSDPLLNRIYSICVRTQINACQGLLVDCPQREQAQYIVDAMIQGLNLFYNFAYTGLHRKFLYDIGHSYTDPGLISAQHPSATLRLIPEWILHWPIAIWNHYLYTGDVRVIEDLYPRMKRVLALFGKYEDPETHLLKGVPGDPHSDHPLGAMDMSGESLTPQNCLYFRALTLAARMAETLDRAEEKKAFEQSAARVRQGINAYLFDGRSRYADCLGSEKAHALASVFPLYFHIVPEERIPEVLDYVVSRGFEPSVYGGFYLCETLYEYDRADHLHALLHERDARWALMLDKGSTTTWEAWRTGGSLSHAWSAYPMKFLLSGLVGIEPLTPGFRTFRIRPHIVGDLQFAEGTVPTPKGPIFARWRKGEEGLSLHVEIPANTSAEIHLPLPDPDRSIIKENGRPISNGCGTDDKPPEFRSISPFSMEGERWRVQYVGSGVYTFEVTTSMDD